jgi:hypothetical protein
MRYTPADQNYLVVLGEITSETHVKTLAPPILVRFIVANNFSLRDVALLRIEDVIGQRGIGASKINALRGFQNSLYEDRLYYQEYYQNNICNLILPLQYDYQDSIYDMILVSIRDFCLIISQRIGSNNFRNAQIIKAYFGIDQPIRSINELKTIHSIHHERIRQIIVNSGLREIFSGQRFLNFQLHPQLLGRIVMFQQEQLYKSTHKSYLSAGGDYDDTIIERVLNILSIAEVCINDRAFLCLNREIVNFREHVRVLTQAMNKEVLPLTYNDIINRIKGDFRSGVISEQIILRLLESELFYTFQVDENQLGFCIRWHLLSSVTSKIKRILWENGERMSRDEIYEDFIERLRLVDQDLISPDQLHIKTDPNLVSITKSGYFEFVENPDDYVNVEPAWIIIEEFIIREGGMVRFEDVKDHLIHQGVFYPDHTIRYYILKCCQTSLDDHELFVHLDYGDQFPQITLRRKNLKDIGNKIARHTIAYLTNYNLPTRKELTHYVHKKLLEDDMDVPKSRVSNYLSSFITRGLITQHYRPTGNHLSIDATILEDLDVEQIGKRKEPEYRTIIRSISIRFLKESKDFSATFDELWQNCVEDFPDHITKANFYKIFNDSNLFEKLDVNGKRIVCLRTDLLPETRSYDENVQVPIEATIAEVATVDTSSELQYFYPKRIEFNWGEFEGQLRKELERGYHLSEEMLSIGIDALYEVLFSNGELKRWGKFFVQSIFELWFTKTDFYDRDICFYNVTTSYETFLRELNPVFADTTNLVDKLGKDRKLSELRTYKFVAREMIASQIDKQKQAFSYILNSLIFFRNLYSHDKSNENLDLGLNNIIKSISDCIALYVYTGYLLKTNEQD